MIHLFTDRHIILAYGKKYPFIYNKHYVNWIMNGIEKSTNNSRPSFCVPDSCVHKRAQTLMHKESTMNIKFATSSKACGKNNRLILF